MVRAFFKEGCAMGRDPSVCQHPVAEPHLAALIRREVAA